MDMIRTPHTRKSGKTMAPDSRPTYSGAFLLAGSMSSSLITVITGFTLCLTIFW